jgi:hypothetical protein
MSGNAVRTFIWDLASRSPLQASGTLRQVDAVVLLGQHAAHRRRRVSEVVVVVAAELVVDDPVKQRPEGQEHDGETGRVPDRQPEANAVNEPGHSSLRST